MHPALNKVASHLLQGLFRSAAFVNPAAASFSNTLLSGNATVSQLPACQLIIKKWTNIASLPPLLASCSSGSSILNSSSTQSLPQCSRPFISSSGTICSRANSGAGTSTSINASGGSGSFLVGQVRAASGRASDSGGSTGIFSGDNNNRSSGIGRNPPSFDLDALAADFKEDPTSTAQLVSDRLTAAQRASLAAALARSHLLTHGSDGDAQKRHADRLFKAADTSDDAQLSRDEFETALHAHETLQGSNTLEAPSWRALATVFLASSIPFIAFGFLDNFIMLVAGEEIDARIGVRLGLTTLASAGLGNTLADVIGVGATTTIESTVRKLPFVRDFKLSKAQLAMSSAKGAKTVGACVGVAIGCLLGLTPLFLGGRFFEA